MMKYSDVLEDDVGQMLLCLGIPLEGHSNKQQTVQNSIFPV